VGVPRARRGLIAARRIFSRLVIARRARRARLYLSCGLRTQVFPDAVARLLVGRPPILESYL